MEKRKVKDSVKYLTAMRKTYQADSELLAMAIDIMCKYQKIEEIIRKYDATWEFHHMKPTIDKIREVIEDGKID